MMASIVRLSSRISVARTNRNARITWLFIRNSMETELARAVGIMMARAKRIYILIVEVNKQFSFLQSRCFYRVLL